MEVEPSSYIVKAVDRLNKIMNTNYFCGKPMELYSRVKGANGLVYWTFNTVENILNNVIKKTMPITILMEKPMYNVLHKTLCQSLDYFEIKLPLIKEETIQVINSTKCFVFGCLEPVIKILRDLEQETKQRAKVITLHTYYRVYYLKIYSWRQADRILSTDRGVSILKSVGTTTDFVEMILNKYLPLPHEESHPADTKGLCKEDATLHHTVERLKQFRSRVAKHIYLALIELEHFYKVEILFLMLYTLIFYMFLLIKYVIYDRWYVMYFG